MPRTKKNPAEAETAPATAVEKPVEETKPAGEKAAKKAPSILKKAAAKKSVEKAEKTEKKEMKEMVEEVYLQAGGNEWNISAYREKVVEAYAAQGHKASSVKKLVVYLKPEEGKAYYVVNDDVNGSIDL